MDTNNGGINFGEISLNDNTQKTQNNTNTTNSSSTADSISIDTKNTDHKTPNSIDTTTQPTSLIGKINEEKKDSNTQNTINLDNINIATTPAQEPTKIRFGTDGRENKAKKHYHINYRKIFILSFGTIVISLLVSGFLYMYNDYIKNYSSSDINTSQNYDNISKGFVKIKDIINKYLYSEHNAYNDIDLIGENGTENLKNLIDSDISYIQKKDILSSSIKVLSNTILVDHKSLDETKKIITKNGFFSDEIGKIIDEKQQIGSIQNSLLSLETIKFSSAINVFSYLDTFVESLSKAINVSKTKIQERTKDIIARGEKDINLYITNCYLNPFEVNYECNVIGDFDKYYKITNDLYFDTKFFKELMHYTDIKLEQTELPSFSITFKKFDQNKDEITFDIDINTFKQDEIELAKKGILSPHIFIFTNLINSLKQSKFIVGESISTKNLQIETKVIDIGFTQFVVHHSHRSFTLPIQKESEREISDFIESRE